MVYEKILRLRVSQNKCLYNQCNKNVTTKRATGNFDLTFDSGRQMAPGISDVSPGENLLPIHVNIPIYSWFVFDGLRQIDIIGVRLKARVRMNVHLIIVASGICIYLYGEGWRKTFTLVVQKGEQQTDRSLVGGGTYTPIIGQFAGNYSINLPAGRCV